LDGLQSSILPASLEIALKASSRDPETLKSLTARLNGPGIREVEYAQEWSQKLQLLLLGIQWAKWVFGGLLLLYT